ncbi:MAG: hypothetical protein AAGG11_21450 [Pseudomonadota bacterium]
MRVEGPFIAGRNWSADAGSGSIHDDTTATGLGFRGGTVAGDVHMNQFVPVLLEAFGPAWWERGFLALSFRSATVDRERVRVVLASDGTTLADTPMQGVATDVTTADAQPARVEMQRDDELLVSRGVAGLGPLPELDSARSRIDPAVELSILERVSAGQDLGSYAVVAAPDKQFQRYDAGLISDALPEYRQGFDGDAARIPACPSTVVEFLWGPPMEGLRPFVDERAVGLFGAIDLAHEQGPLWLNQPYTVEARVLGLGASPKTELLWFESTATDAQQRVAVRFRMMLRFMKASVAESAQ